MTNSVDLLVNLFKLVYAIGGLLVVGGFIAILKHGINFLKVHTNSQKQQEVIADIETAVTAAEQMYDNGEDKKAYVEDLLVQMGYEINDSINAMIESAVNRMSINFIQISEEETKDSEAIEDEGIEE